MNNTDFSDSIKRIDKNISEINHTLIDLNARFGCCSQSSIARGRLIWAAIGGLWAIIAVLAYYSIVSPLHNHRVESHELDNSGHVADCSYDDWDDEKID